MARSDSNKQFHEKHRGVNRSLAKDERAMAPILAVLATLMGVLVVINLFPTILAPIMQQSDTQLSTYNNSDATAAYDNIKTSSWGTIQLTGNVPIVMVAFMFIAILGGAMI